MVKFFLIGDDNAGTYFEISEADGELSIKRSLNEDDAEVYKVCVSQLGIITTH